MPDPERPSPTESAVTELPFEHRHRRGFVRGPRKFFEEFAPPAPGDSHIPDPAFLAAMMYCAMETSVETVVYAAREHQPDGTDSPLRRAMAELDQQVLDANVAVPNDEPKLRALGEGYFEQYGYTADKRGVFEAAQDLYGTRMSLGLVHPIVGLLVIRWHADTPEPRDAAMEATVVEYDAVIDEWLETDTDGRVLREARAVGLIRRHLRGSRPMIPWMSQPPPS